MTYSTNETEVRIPSSTPEIELTGTMLAPEEEGKKWPAVLFIHGMPDGPESMPLRSLMPRMRALAERGFVTAAFACRGVGGSGGAFEQLTNGHATRDLGAAFRYLRSQENVMDNKVGLWGSSWGGYLSAMSLSDIDPASLFLNVPALYEEARYEEGFGAATKEEKRAFRATFQGRRHEAFIRIAAYGHPIFVAIAEKDELIPLNCQIGYLAELGNHPASDAHVLKDSGHIVRKYPEAEDILRNLTVDWFTRTLC